MITVTIKKNKNEIKQIEMKGHALYDTLGKDIVYAGVSSILTTTVNAILRFNENYIRFHEAKTFVLDVLVWDDVVEKLLINMIDLLKELSISYPENIKIREEEI